eukprot:6471753-Amphidinium_carterae.1
MSPKAKSHVMLPSQEVLLPLFGPKTRLLKGHEPDYQALFAATWGRGSGEKAVSHLPSDPE